MNFTSSNFKINIDSDFILGKNILNSRQIPIFVLFKTVLKEFGITIDSANTIVMKENENFAARSVTVSKSALGLEYNSSQNISKFLSIS